MLTQTDVARLLAKDPAPEQHIAYQILSAYCYCKLSHGNLPSETLGKIHSIHRKLILLAERTSSVNLTSTSPIARALEAIKTQLAIVSRKYNTHGPASFGRFGAIGTAGSVDAIWAWSKATDGKVTRFEDGSSERVATDAGRVSVAHRAQNGEALPEGPPSYAAAPGDEQIPTATEEETTPSATLTSANIEEGRARLALLKEEMTRRQLEDSALEAGIMDNAVNPLNHGMRPAV